MIMMFQGMTCRFFKKVESNINKRERESVCYMFAEKEINFIVRHNKTVGGKKRSAEECNCCFSLEKFQLLLLSSLCIKSGRGIWVS